MLCYVKAGAHESYVLSKNSFVTICLSKDTSSHHNFILLAVRHSRKRSNIEIESKNQPQGEMHAMIVTCTTRLNLYK